MGGIAPSHSTIYFGSFLGIIINKYYDNSEHGKYVPSFARCMHTCYSLTV